MIRSKRCSCSGFRTPTLPQRTQSYHVPDDSPFTEDSGCDEFIPAVRFDGSCGPVPPAVMGLTARAYDMGGELVVLEGDDQSGPKDPPK